MERKPLSKKTRFEVFKRDSFTCQYCGSKAPDVILEVDHIVPVAEGGTNDILNLITSCRNCNRGKGARTLSDKTAVERQRKQLDDLNEIREQTEMLIEWKQELRSVEETQIAAIDSLINDLRGESMTERGHRDIRLLIRKFGFQEVYTATEIAMMNQRYRNTEFAFSKIGGICYNRRKAMEENAE